ncbi:MAG: Tetratricopeptide 2 repeat protein [Deltaproteobacteria bacterium]|nr:Tetratricopeptide 2 repeat protein [Deltaproteobacteria bacterium]
MLSRLLKQIFRSEPAPLRPQSAPGLAEAERALEQGDVAGARTLLARAVAAHPENYEARCLLGEVHYNAAEHPAAIEQFRRAIAQHPNEARAHAGLGLALFGSGDVEGAHAEFALAGRFDPRNADTWTHLGLVHLQLGNAMRAEESLRQALALAPRHPHALNNLGMLEQLRGNHRAALAAFQRAVEAKPDFALARSNYGLALREDEKLDAAVAELVEAARLRPDAASIHHNLGVLLQDMGRFEEGLTSLQRALELDPGSADTATAIAAVYHRMDRPEDAKTWFRRAIEIVPEHAEAHGGLGELELWLGDFEHGWDDYEYRLRGRLSPARKYPFAVWDGEDPAGRTILVYPEQGLGDIIMFASCIPDLEAHGARVVIPIEKRLLTLFSRSFPDAFVADAGDAKPEGLPKIDGYVAMGSLPRVFRRGWNAFPERDRYLAPDEARVAQWRERLAAIGPGVKIGLGWRGGLVRTGREFRTLAADDLKPLLATPGAHFVCLQHDASDAELADIAARTGVTMHVWRETLTDLEEMAALVCALDGVATVCGSLVHLTGALGRPVIVMVPKASGWRYLREGDRLPWYASARLARQRTHGEWSDVIAVVQDHVAALAARR